MGKIVAAPVALAGRGGSTGATRHRTGSGGRRLGAGEAGAADQTRWRGHQPVDEEEEAGGGGGLMADDDELAPAGATRDLHGISGSGLWVILGEEPKLVGMVLGREDGAEDEHLVRALPVWSLVAYATKALES